VTRSTKICAGVALGAMVAALASAAQAQQQAPQQTNSDAAEVVITGIRASQRQSIELKRDAVNAIDAIASEDLGKMPDQNVAESLQRVPGITIDRNRGVGNGVTVRGLGPQFNTVTVNGRVIATDGAGREFNFDILPSELIAGASVYKSPQADLNGASIGATVDVHTLRPLEQRTGLRGGGSLRLNYDDLGNKKTPSGAAYLTWKSESGRVGASLVVSYDDKNERTDNFFVGASSYPRSFDDGYYGSATNNGGSLCVGSVSGGTCSPRIDTSKVTLFRNVDMYHNFVNQVEFSHRKRLGVDGAFQFKPTDELVLTLDGLVSHDNEHYHGSGIVPDFSGGTLVNQVVTGGSDTTETVAGLTRTVHVGGTAMSESFHDGTVDEIVENRPAKSTTSLFGFNAKWSRGPFSLSLDLDTSNARFRDAGGLFTTVRLKHMDYTYDRNTGSPIAKFTLSNPGYANAATDVSHRLGHYMQSEGQNFDDTIHEGRIDGRWDGTAVSAFAGAGYSERTKRTTGFTEPNACAYCGSDVVLPAGLFTPTNYNFFGGRGGGRDHREPRREPDARHRAERGGREALRRRVRGPGVPGSRDPDAADGADSRRHRRARAEAPARRQEPHAPGEPHRARRASRGAPRHRAGLRRPHGAFGRPAARRLAGGRPADRPRDQEPAHADPALRPAAPAAPRGPAPR